MNIALVVPPRQQLAQDHFHRTPQTGIAYIAGGLRKHGHDVTIFNSKYKNIFEDELGERLCSVNYDLVGFSAMTFEIKSVGRLARRIKTANENCMIVIGGCHLNALPRETMDEFPDFDMGVIGEHEDHIGEVFDLLHHRDYDGLGRFDGIIFRQNNELRCGNLGRRFIRNLDSIEWPAYDLFDDRRLTPAYISVRGCPFGCCFCQQNSGRALRFRDPSKVCDEIEYFSTWFNQKEFWFRDETFTASKKHAAALCNELIRRGLNRKLKWTCETHSRVSDYELLCLMREAGCFYVNIGIESGSDEILKATGKSTTVEVIREACNNIRKANLKLGALNILGHPYETKRTMLKTIALTASLNPDSVTFSMMTPFPGTMVYEYAKQGKGGLKLLTRDWEKYDNYAGYAMEWENFSVRTLKMFQAFGIVFCYLRNLRLKEFAQYLNVHRKGVLAYLLSYFGQPDVLDSDQGPTT